MEVVIGGGKPKMDARTGRITTRVSKWFSVVLTEAAAPRAFYKGAPYNAISSLEFVATAVVLQIFGLPSSR